MEIQPRRAYGISETPEASFGMEAIVFAVTGKNMCSRNVRGIGMAIGTDIVIIGGMATGAASSMDLG